MKISDIAKKLDISIKELRKYAKELGFVIAQKSNTISDKKAKEFIETLLDKGLVEKEEEKEETKEEEEEIRKIEVPDIITVKDFSERLKLPVTKVITELMKSGVMASINENIDFETAEIIGEYLGFEVKKEKQNTITKRQEAIGTKKERPPVVAIIGHVDHGKTTLLDHIRKTNVVGGESGGITQHIGSYQIKRGERKITFLDTPGHEAFSAMREHGVKITDIAVLVVAADDGVKPQTKESVNFAKQAGVPIIVAINKIDKSEANIEKTKKELADIDLIPEEWGGKTIMCMISAKKGQGIEELLDLIILAADMKKPESYIDVPANGFIIESHLSGTKGAVATVLIRDGFLTPGDAFVIGDNIYGKIRSITDYSGKKIKSASPSMPVRISGLSSTPDFGELLEVKSSLKEAKGKATKSIRDFSVKRIAKKTLADLSLSVKAGEIKELPLIIKVDVAGSLKAIEDSISNMKFEGVSTKIISSAVGDINESDVKMAQASSALVIGFRVDISPGAKVLIENSDVSVEVFGVIYELLDKIVLTLSGLLEPELEEVEIGRSKILKIFKDGKRDKILGVRLEQGKLKKEAEAKIFRDQDMICKGRIDNLKKIDKDVSEIIKKGEECGIHILINKDGAEKIKIEEGDLVIAYAQEEKGKELKKIEENI